MLKVLPKVKNVILNNCLDLIFQIHHIAEVSFYTNLEKVIFIMINGKPFWYFISKYWRPQMHKRQKDVRDKKILSITYHCSSFPLPPFHSYIRSAIKRCCMKPYIHASLITPSTFQRVNGKSCSFCPLLAPPQPLNKDKGGTNHHPPSLCWVSLFEMHSH